MKNLMTSANNIEGVSVATFWKLFEKDNRTYGVECASETPFEDRKVLNELRFNFP